MLLKEDKIDCHDNTTLRIIALLYDDTLALR